MVWDILCGDIVVKMGGLMAPVTCLAITSNDAFLTVACEDETVRVFSMVSSQELHELTVTIIPIKNKIKYIFFRDMKQE